MQLGRVALAILQGDQVDEPLLARRLRLCDSQPRLQSAGATLRQLADAADPTTRTFAARYVLRDVAARAPIGATVTIALDMPGATACMEVPAGALHDTGRGLGVWVVRGGSAPTVAWQRVQVSAIGEETATILSGLKPGQRFVAMGAHMLHQGQRVRLAPPAPGAAR